MQPEGGEVCKQAFPGYLAALGSMMALGNLFADPEELAENPLGGLYGVTAWTANVPFVVVSLLLLIWPKRRRSVAPERAPTT